MFLKVAVWTYQIMSAKANLKVTKTKTRAAALKQETYNLLASDSDLKLEHDLHCEFVELGDSVSVS